MRKRRRQALEPGMDGNTFLDSSSIPRELKVSAPYGEPIRALLVEPSLASQETLETIFQQHEVQVEICCKGSEAVQRLTQENFDFICVFAPLKNVTDEALFRSLQSGAKNQQTHVVVFTAGESEGESFTNYTEFTRVFHEQDVNSYSPYLIHVIAEARKNRFVKGRVLYIDSDSRKARAVDSRSSGNGVGGHSISRNSTSL